MNAVDTWLLRTGDVALPRAVPIRLFRPIEPGPAYAYAASAQSPGPGWLPLDCIRDVPGSASGDDAPFHYVVETDVQPAFEAEFNAWYDQEHLPGLAAVPGTVRAARYRIDGQSPSYHACYDLRSLEVFNSPAWLAVRATAWSSRVRPAFVNTRRVMFRRA